MEFSHCYNAYFRRHGALCRSHLCAEVQRGYEGTLPPAESHQLPFQVNGNLIFDAAFSGEVPALPVAIYAVKNASRPKPVIFHRPRTGSVLRFRLVGL